MKIYTLMPETFTLNFNFTLSGTSLSPSVYFSEMYSTCTICQVRTCVLKLIVVVVLICNFSITSRRYWGRLRSFAGGVRRGTARRPHVRCNLLRRVPREGERRHQLRRPQRTRGTGGGHPIPRVERSPGDAQAAAPGRTQEAPGGCVGR